MLRPGSRQSLAGACALSPLTESLIQRRGAIPVGCRGLAAKMRLAKSLSDSPLVRSSIGQVCCAACRNAVARSPLRGFACVGWPVSCTAGILACCRCRLEACGTVRRNPLAENGISVGSMARIVERSRAAAPQEQGRRAEEQECCGFGGDREAYVVEVGGLAAGLRVQLDDVVAPGGH